MAGKNPWDEEDGGERNKPSEQSDRFTRKPGRERPGEFPDPEEMIRKIMDQFRGNGGKKNGGSSGGEQSDPGRYIMIGFFVLVVLWALTGFYRVNSGEKAVITRFGSFVGVAGPGLNYRLPYPFDQQTIVDIERNRSVTIGAPERAGLDSGAYEGNQMLTGDENIVNIQFDVRWKVSDPKKFLFNVRDPETSVRAVAESAMREVIGQTAIDPILTEARDVVEQKVRDQIQSALDVYDTGVRILQVAIKEASPPEQVIQDFQDVQAARADQERFEEEANAYANRILPQARGEAEKIRQEAEAYKQKVVAEAQGEASRFQKISAEYQKAPEVTKKRIYFETVERVLSGKDKTVLGEGLSQKTLPYLPLKPGSTVK